VKNKIAQCDQDSFHSPLIITELKIKNKYMPILAWVVLVMGKIVFVLLPWIVEILSVMQVLN